MYRREFFLATAALPVFLGKAALAAESNLVLDGDLNGGAPVSLSDDSLLSLPQTHIDTSTQWTKGFHRFSGPLLADLLSRYSAGPGDLRLAAINSYSVTVNRNLITQDAPIIANRMDGKPFSRRKKGPLWVIFPYDKSAKYQGELVFAASVWQLSQITVLGV
tara:strand:+ start:3826 stop:4311 length:486 start_codon:yes stop_codon:yes gene_type:complete